MPDHPIDRALQLLSLLQTHTFWPGPELCSRLDVSARTLRRDVDRLRLLGYPVDATPGPSGGYRLAAGAHLPPLLLDDDEAVAIAVGLRSAAGASIEGMEDTTLRTLAKLEQLLPDRLRRRVRAVHSNVVALHWPTDTLVDGGRARGPRAGVPRWRAGALPLRTPRRRDRAPARGAAPARRRRPAVVSRGVGHAARRLAHVPARSTARRRARRCALRARTLPGGGDAAAFVAESLRSLPMPYAAVVEVRGAPSDCARCCAATTPTSRTSAPARCACGSQPGTSMRCS